MVMDSYDWFDLGNAEAWNGALLDGFRWPRLHRPAGDRLKLIDQLGDEKAAVAWLVAEKKIESDLPVRDFKLTPQFGTCRSCARQLPSRSMRSA